jgi:dihydrofolate reductase
MLVSLDGYIEGPDGMFDWATPDEALHQHFNEVEREAGVHLYGRRLYEMMRYWETADTNPGSSAVEREYARLWQQVPTITSGVVLLRYAPPRIDADAVAHQDKLPADQQAARQRRQEAQR